MRSGRLELICANVKLMVRIRRTSRHAAPYLRRSRRILGRGEGEEEEEGGGEGKEEEEEEQEEEDEEEDEDEEEEEEEVSFLLSIIVLSSPPPPLTLGSSSYRPFEDHLAIHGACAKAISALSFHFVTNSCG